MIKKITVIAAILLLQTTVLFAQQAKRFSLTSPDGKITVNITGGTELQWEVKHGADQVIRPSSISLQLQNGEMPGKNVVILSDKKQTVNQTINAIAYKKKTIIDNYNELILDCKDDYGFIFRVYNDGAAYRFYSKKKNDLIIQSEKVEFNFNKDYKVLIPHTSDLRGGERYTCSFEEFYADIPLSKFNKDTLGYLPLMVKLENNKKSEKV